MAQTAKLGKGLSALMEDDYQDVSASQQEAVPGTEMRLLDVSKMQSGKYQPRLNFDQEKLQELAASIAKNGVMQPVLVRPVDSESHPFEIIAGERRWRAAKLAGLDEMPVLIRELDDKAAIELALIENIQRSDLSPLEEADGYQRLMDEFAYTQETLAEKVGKSRSHVANLLRLRSLPEAIKNLLDKGQLAMGHARALMNAENNVLLAQQVVERGLSVRQTERLVKDLQQGDGDSHAERESAAGAKGRSYAPKAPAGRGYSQPVVEKSEDILALENALSENLSLKVEIDDHGEQQGRITLHYGSLEELDSILRRLDSAF